MSDLIRSTLTNKNEANVLRPKIIIAEKNQVIRSRMARALSGLDHIVETTASAAHLMGKLLHSGLSIVVLGEGLEEGLSVSMLVPLLKSCNPHSTIILVADDVLPVEEVKVRQHGIFYHTNRPLCALGWNELKQAVSCACNQTKYETAFSRAH